MHGVEFSPLMYKLSRYSFLFKKEDLYLIYNSRTNSFYEQTKDGYDFLTSYLNNQSKTFSSIESSFIENLKSALILVEENEDDCYVQDQLLNHYIKTFNPLSLHLTIVPTITCNLRCPYCFEENKPTGIISDTTIESLVKFIKDHKGAKKCSITWFGGEPLLALKQIRKTLDKIQSIDKLPLTYHSIVTNGTLLNEDAIELFSKYPLHSMQVTFDGFKNSHDSKRFFADGTGSFDRIVENVLAFARHCPRTKMSFRINVDNNNITDYIEIHKYLTDIFKGHDIHIYAGILRANRGCESETFFTSKDHVRFNRYLVENGIPAQTYPSHCDKGCCATSTSSYVIGPKGEIYCCWEHVGNPKLTIGNISSETLTNRQLYNNFILNGHCFNDSRCKECGFLPICSGGCAKKRLENLTEGTSHDLCSIYHDKDGTRLSELLINYYYENK